MPEQEDPFEKMVKEFSTEVKFQILGEDIGKAEHYYKNIKSVIGTRGVYTRLPVDIIID